MKDNEVNLDDIFNKVKEMETIKKVEVKNENVDIKVKESEVKENQDVELENPKKEKIDLETFEIDVENLKKELASKEKALNDTKKSYQTVNQKLVLSKKKYNSVLEKLKNTIFNSENTLLEEDELNNGVKELSSIFEINESELENKEVEVKEDNKTKTILEKLENEFVNFKKYNKSKDLEANYKAFFDSVHLLNVEERQNLLEYLEEAEPTDSIEKILMLGNDYRNLFETGLKTHKNLFAYVNDLHKQIDKLNEELSISRKNVDNSFDESDNKVIKTRYSANGSGIDNKTYNSFDKNLLNSLGILR